MSIIHDTSKKDKIKEILQKCKEEGNQYFNNHICIRSYIHS